MNDVACLIAPPRIADDKVERSFHTALHQLLKSTTHRSTRILAKEAGVSHIATPRSRRTFGIQYLRSETSSLSRDPQYIEMDCRIDGFYMRPPDSEPLLRASEESLVLALDRFQPTPPLTPAVLNRRIGKDLRHGSTSIPATLNCIAAHALGKFFRQFVAEECVAFRRIIDDTVSAALDLHSVQDSCAAHEGPAAKRWPQRHPRLHLHIAPTSVRWIDLANPWCSRCSHRRFSSVIPRSACALGQDIRDFLDNYNNEPTTILWTEAANETLNVHPRRRVDVRATGSSTS
jgi:hypothetical protein